MWENSAQRRHRREVPRSLRVKTSLIGIQHMSPGPGPVTLHVFMKGSSEKWEKRGISESRVQFIVWVPCPSSLNCPETPELMQMKQTALLWCRANSYDSLWKPWKVHNNNLFLCVPPSSSRLHGDAVHPSPLAQQRSKKGALILKPVGGAAESKVDGCKIHLCLVPLEIQKVTQLSASKIQYLNLSSMSLFCVPVRDAQSLSDAPLTAWLLAVWTIHVQRRKIPHPRWRPPLTATKHRTAPPADTQPGTRCVTTARCILNRTWATLGCKNSSKTKKCLNSTQIIYNALNTNIFQQQTKK